MTTISSLASLTTSAITVPKPLMMAQSSRKYSINISIVLLFLSLKVSHFLRDSKGFRCLSADFNAISTSVHHNRLSPFPLPVNVLFPQCRNSDNQYYINTETLNLRFYNNQIIRNSVFQQICKYANKNFRKSINKKDSYSEFQTIRLYEFQTISILDFHKIRKFVFHKISKGDKTNKPYTMLHKL